MWSLTDRIKYLFSEKFHSILIKKDDSSWYSFRHKYLGLPVKISAIIPNINTEVLKIMYTQHVESNVAEEMFYNNVLKMIADEKINTPKPAKYILNIFRTSYQDCIQWFKDNEYDCNIIPHDELIKEKRCVLNLLQKERNVNFIVINLEDNGRGSMNYRVNIFDNTSIDRNDGYKNELVTTIKQTPITFSFEDDGSVKIIDEDSDGVIYFEETEEQALPKNIFDRIVNIVDKNNRSVIPQIHRWTPTKVFTKSHMEDMKKFTSQFIKEALSTAEYHDTVEDNSIMNAYLFNISVLVCVELTLDILDDNDILIKDLRDYEERIISVLWNVHLSQIEYEDFNLVYEIIESIQILLSEMKELTNGEFENSEHILVVFLKFIGAYLDLNSVIFRLYEIFSNTNTVSQLIYFDANKEYEDEMPNEEKNSIEVNFFTVMENLSNTLIKHGLTFATFSDYYKEN